MTFDDLKFELRGDGIKQAVVTFANGRGASIICGPYSCGESFGLYELAVTKPYEDRWTIDYDTPITEDVLGHLSPEEVTDILGRIEELEPVK